MFQADSEMVGMRATSVRAKSDVELNSLESPMIHIYATANSCSFPDIIHGDMH